MKLLLFVITASFMIIFSTACNQSISPMSEEIVKEPDIINVILPTDRRLSHSEAMSLRASDVNFMNEDHAKLELLERYAQDPNEINAQYAWATYQTWHENEPNIETKGYQTIFKLAQLGQPHACADIYIWSEDFSEEFFQESLKSDEIKVNKIKDSCLKTALEYNANGIKYDYIERFFFKYSNETSFTELSFKLMKNVDQKQLSMVKEYLLMYLFSWDNAFINDFPANNLAEVNILSQYLQILAYDPYYFDAIESCAWLTYYDKEVIPYLKEHNLPNLSTVESRLTVAIPLLRSKLKSVKVNQEQCQTRYIEIRDIKRDNDSFEVDFY